MPETSSLLAASSNFVISMAVRQSKISEIGCDNGTFSFSTSPSTHAMATSTVNQSQPANFVAQRISLLCNSIREELANEAPQGLTSVATDSKEQLSRYVVANRLNVSARAVDAIKFWLENRLQYPAIAHVAEDLLSIPASQAYVERIFSVCGILTSGRRNRMEKNLPMRVFLKLNHKYLISAGQKGNAAKR